MGCRMHGMRNRVPAEWRRSDGVLDRAKAGRHQMAGARSLERTGCHLTREVRKRAQAAWSRARAVPMKIPAEALPMKIPTEPQPMRRPQIPPVRRQPGRIPQIPPVRRQPGRRPQIPPVRRQPGRIPSQRRHSPLRLAEIRRRLWAQVSPPGQHRPPRAAPDLQAGRQHP